MIEQYNTLIKDFGIMVGFDNLAANEAGECILGIDEHVVHIVLQDERVLIFSSIGYMTENNKELIYERLLSANYLFSETKGATLGVSPIDQEIQLIVAEQLQYLDAAIMVRVLEGFLECLDYWNGLYEELSAINEVSINEEDFVGLRV